MRFPVTLNEEASNSLANLHLVGGRDSMERNKVRRKSHHNIGARQEGTACGSELLVICHLKR